MDSGFICLNLHTKELCPPGRLTSKRAPHELRRAWVLGKAVWVLHVKEVWRENEDKGPSLNHQQPSGGWAVGSWSPGPPHPLQDGSAFLSNWDPQHPGPPAPRTPRIQDPRHPGPPALWVPESPLQPPGGQVLGTMPGPGSQWGRQLPSAPRGEERRESPCPIVTVLFQGAAKQEKNMKC